MGYSRCLCGVFAQKTHLLVLLTRFCASAGFRSSHGDATGRHMRFPTKTPMRRGLFIDAFLGDFRDSAITCSIYAFRASVIFRILLPDRMRCGNSPHALPRETIRGGELIIELCVVYLRKTQLLALFTRDYASVSFRHLPSASAHLLRPRMRCSKSPRAFPHETIHGGRWDYLLMFV